MVVVPLTAETFEAWVPSLPPYWETAAGGTPGTLAEVLEEGSVRDENTSGMMGVISRRIPDDGVRMIRQNEESVLGGVSEHDGG